MSSYTKPIDRRLQRKTTVVSHQDGSEPSRDPVHPGTIETLRPSCIRHASTLVTARFGTTNRKEGNSDRRRCSQLHFTVILVVVEMNISRHHHIVG